MVVNLVATVILTVAMAGGEVGGMAQVLSAWTGGPYRVWLVVGAAALAVALVKLSRSTLEKVLGLAGLATVVVVASLIAARPHWGSLLRQAARPWPPPRASTVDYLESVVAQIGSMIIPYQLVFFSSGVAEAEWGPDDVGVNRWNVFVGYGLGTVVALALMANAAVFYAPRQVQVAHLSQVVAFRPPLRPGRRGHRPAVHRHAGRHPGRIG